jgi:hypothetical protein
MLFCARATRGLGRPALDTRSGRPPSAPSRGKVEERCSLDARSKGQPGPPSKDWKCLAPSQSSLCAPTHLLKSETVQDTIRIFGDWLELGKLCVPDRQK